MDEIVQNILKFLVQSGPPGIIGALLIILIYTLRGSNSNIANLTRSLDNSIKMVGTALGDGAATQQKLTEISASLSASGTSAAAMYREVAGQFKATEEAVKANTAVTEANTAVRVQNTEVIADLAKAVGDQPRHFRRMIDAVAVATETHIADTMKREIGEPLTQKIQSMHLEQGLTAKHIDEIQQSQGLASQQLHQQTQAMQDMTKAMSEMPAAVAAVLAPVIEDFHKMSTDIAATVSSKLGAFEKNLASTLELVGKTIQAPSPTGDGNDSAADRGQ